MGRESAAAVMPPNFTRQSLHDAAAGCQACDLRRRGTQTVFGEGAEAARVMLVVGPAGRLRDKTLEEAAACVPWLEAELEGVKPRILVCLGATAAQALLGRRFRVTGSRGKWVESPLAPYVTATAHPSSILRARGSDTRHAEMAHFIGDLRPVAQAPQTRTRKAR